MKLLLNDDWNLILQILDKIQILSSWDNKFLFFAETTEVDRNWPLTMSFNDNELANGDQPTHGKFFS